MVRDEAGQNGLAGQFHNEGVARQFPGAGLSIDGGYLRARNENVGMLERLPPIAVDHTNVAQQDRWRMGSLGPSGKGEKCDNEGESSDVPGEARECRRDASMLG